MKELLERFGCEVITLNYETTGIFTRNPEPIPENLNQVCEEVKKHNADLGNKFFIFFLFFYFFIFLFYFYFIFILFFLFYFIFYFYFILFYFIFYFYNFFFIFIFIFIF